MICENCGAHDSKLFKVKGKMVCGPCYNSYNESKKKKEKKEEVKEEGRKSLVRQIRNIDKDTVITPQKLFTNRHYNVKG